jgi:3-dehydroquinate synthase
VSASALSARVPVGLAQRSYDILIASDLIAEAGQHVSPVLAQRRVVVVTDQTVAELHLAPLAAALDRAGIAHETIVLPAGEATKDFAHLARLLDDLAERKVERRTTLVALGGGVIGDLTGFAASIMLRGIEFIQVPTTLLSQIDSSVGGKTGINTRFGKNLVGSFHQPRLVLADVACLDTLPRRELLAGYAEVVKTALIDGAPFFEWLEANGVALLAGDRARRIEAVRRCCELKARVVADDERETGDRALLNLGHTFGHALEAATGFGARLLHGEAVAIGLALAFDLSQRMGLCTGQEAVRVRRHLASVGLPTTPADVAGLGAAPSELVALMARDKKVRDGHVKFVLPHGIGRIVHGAEADPAALLATLAA